MSLHGVLKKLTRLVTLEVPRNVSFKQLVVTWQCMAVGCFQCAILDLVGFSPILLSRLQQFQDCTPNPEHCGGDGGCEGATSELAFEYASKPLIWFDYVDKKVEDHSVKVRKCQSGCDEVGMYQRHGLHDSQHYSGDINRDLVENNWSDSEIT